MSEYLRIQAREDRPGEWEWVAFGPGNTFITLSDRTYASKAECDRAVAALLDSSEIPPLTDSYRQETKSATERLVQTHRAKLDLGAALNRLEADLDEGEPRPPDPRSGPAARPAARPGGAE